MTDITLIHKKKSFINMNTTDPQLINYYLHFFDSRWKGWTPDNSHCEPPGNHVWCLGMKSTTTTQYTTPWLPTYNSSSSTWHIISCVPVPIAVVAMTVRGASAAVHMETVFGGGTLACKSWVHCTDRSRWPRHWQMYRHAAYRQYILFDQSTISWYLWPHDNVKKYVCVSYFNFQE